MIAGILAKIGLEAGVKTGGRLLGLILIAGLFAASGLAFWRGMAAIERMELAAFNRGKAEADALWTVQIATSNAAVERDRADRAIATARASAEAEQKITGLETALSQWEARNAARPDQACLDPADVDALNRLRRPGPRKADGENRVH